MEHTWKARRFTYYMSPLEVLKSAKLIQKFEILIWSRAILTNPYSIQFSSLNHNVKNFILWLYVKYSINFVFDVSPKNIWDEQFIMHEKKTSLSLMFFLIIFKDKRSWHSMKHTT